MKAQPNRTEFPPDDNGPLDDAPGEKKRYRVMTPIQNDRGSRGDSKTFWHRVGMAWENPPKNDRPASISIRLNSAPFNGELVLFLDEGRPEDGGDTRRD